jgi:predicted glycoside hydrolase/deacetylase ChbG (UPF0249 family)
MISDARDGCLVICHPGWPDAILADRDGVLDAREAELDYFAGEQFPQDLDEAGVRLSRLRDSFMA